MKYSSVNRFIFIFSLCTILTLSLCGGVVYAQITSSTSISSNNAIPLAKPVSSFWKGSTNSSSSATTEVTGSTITLSPGQYLYSKANTFGMKCVVRYRAEPATELSLGWDDLGNGWRLLPNIFQSSSLSFTGEYMLFLDSNASGSVTFHIIMEFMQTEGATATSGFVKEWSPLLREQGQIKPVASNGDRVLRQLPNWPVYFNTSKTGAYFGVFVTSGADMPQLGSLAASTATLDTSNTVYCPLTTSDNQTFTCSAWKYSASQTSLMLLNNIYARMVFVVGINFLLYDSNKNLIDGVAISGYSLSLSSAWVAVSGIHNTYAAIVSSQMVSSGLGTLPNSLANMTLTTDLPVAAAYARPILTISAIDEDAFQFTRDADVKAGNTTSFTEVYNALNTGGKLIDSNQTTNAVSKYIHWLKRLDSTNLTYYKMYADFMGYSALAT